MKPIFEKEKQFLEERLNLELPSDCWRDGNSIYPIIPKDEIEWLKRELSDRKKYIIFSHHSLVNEHRDRGIHNKEEIRRLFQGKDVLLCMNGHDHGDEYTIVGTLTKTSTELEERSSRFCAFSINTIRCSVIGRPSSFFPFPKCDIVKNDMKLFRLIFVYISENTT